MVPTHKAPATRGASLFPQRRKTGHASRDQLRPDVHTLPLPSADAGDGGASDFGVAGLRYNMRTGTGAGKE